MFRSARVGTLSIRLVAEYLFVVQKFKKAINHASKRNFIYEIINLKFFNNRSRTQRPIKAFGSATFLVDSFFVVVLV